MKQIRFLLVSLVILVSMPIMLLAQTATPTPNPDITPEVTPEIESVTIEIEASEGQEIDPPLTIDLPEGWVSLNSTLVIQDITGLRILPYTIYAGLVNEDTGIGYIVLLWGFSNVALMPDSDNTTEVKINPLWMDCAYCV